MKTVLACVAISAALVGSAMAEVRYDLRLEQAVKAKVAQKIGNIRSGFDCGSIAEFLRLPDAIVTGSVEQTAAGDDMLSGVRGTLGFPIERRASRRVF